MADVSPAFQALRQKTAPLLLAERAREAPHAVAYRAKHLGIYRERTWRDYAALVGRCALGLRALGLARGDRVAIMGDPCEEWMIADMAAQAAGAISYGIYPTASAAEVEYQIADGGASIFVAENQEYVDKILPLLERLPAIRWIVVIDDSAMFGYDHPRLKPFSEMLDAGGPDNGPYLEALEQMARSLDPKGPAFIVYTSGTTGHPKGALISHGTHLAAAYTIVSHYPVLARSEHRIVIFLPLCHVFGRDAAITLPLMSRLVPHFGEDLEELPQTLFEVAPTALFTVPRYLQKFASQVLVGIANSTPLKRAVYRAALGMGRACARRRWSGRNDALTALLNAAARLLAFGPILNKMGLDRLQLLLSGGAPLPPETMALWQIWGVNALQVYGQTETAGAFISGQKGPFAKPGSVGTVVEGWTARLAEGDGSRGELLLKSEDLFDGYWGKPEATAEVLDAEGWLHTGDVAEWSDGSLVLVDRARDFIVTSGGKTISPSTIENIARASPYIAEVIVIGHGRNYLTALIEIDYDTVADWARGRNVAYTGYTSLAHHPEVRKLLQGEIDKANAQLARVEQIKRFNILPKALDPEEEGEPVTPTRKVKRKLMAERFSALVEAMYDHREERLVAEEIGGILQN